MSFAKIRSGFFFLVIGLLSLGFLYIIRPFFYPIFWAAILAILFYPVYAALNHTLKMPNVSAALSLVITAVAILLPLSIIVILIFNQSADLYQSVTSGNWTLKVQNIASWLHGTPFEAYAQKLQNNWAGYAADATKTIAAFLFTHIKTITQDSFRFVFLLFMTLYTLFFFFRDGEKILRRLQYLSPLGNNHEVLLYERFTSTSRATLKGGLIVGSIQGALGGLLFWATGVEGAIVWGVIMFLFSLIPGIGTFIVWLPAGIIMIAMGNVWQGVTILVVGLLLISTIDNLLRPPLIGKDIQLHPLIVLFSTLGGILVFGVSGFVIGPVIAALYLSVISIYDSHYLRYLKNNE
jgi:predicted PurR-regulated permease PerM